MVTMIDQILKNFFKAFSAPGLEKILFGSTIVGPIGTSLSFDFIKNALP